MRQLSKVYFIRILQQIDVSTISPQAFQQARQQLEQINLNELQMKSIAAWVLGRFTKGILEAKQMFEDVVTPLKKKMEMERDGVQF